MPSQRVNEASDARMLGFGAERRAGRPYLISTDRRLQRESEADSGFGRDAGLERRRLIRVLDQHVTLAVAEDRTTRVLRTWSLRAAVKRTLDIIGAIALGIVFAPLAAVIVVLLASEGGPVIYRHRRIGRDGNVFKCLKFRSMVPDAGRVLRQLLERQPELKAEWLRDHKLRSDPRITRLGRFLRRTSLDELPQIWNVLRGEMSLVGPRPVVREELMRYGRCLAVYLAAKPGITGLWQVTGRNNTDYRRRVALDVYYVRKQTLLLDLFIIIKTTGVVLGGGGAY